ncbi:hypothetical protein ACUNWD_13005 [Sunxiuqinia sp. A32]|uniref:hypothetical protein n=1 Tax=Sunxiuqinia sp. A32 TaxID=3461496 RepID=UPI0040455DCC
MNTNRENNVNRRQFLNYTALGVVGSAITGNVFGKSINEFGVDPESEVDQTEKLQVAINEGASVLFFPDGNYKTGTLNIPANKTLIFSQKATLLPIPNKIEDKNLLVVTGDDVRIEGINYDFTWNGATLNETPVWNLIFAEGVSNLLVSKSNVRNSDKREVMPLSARKRRGRLYNLDGTDPKENYSHLGYYNSQTIVYTKNCKNIVLEDSVGSRLHGMICADNCCNVTSRGNHMISGNHITRFAEGGENLRHHDNWSRDVKYQVVWFGGSPDPGRKKDVPNGTSTVVHRDVKFGMEGYNRHTSGAFDILIQNNYAEYGNTLAWGNKGRQVIIDGNIARFISDYAYGTEGGENIIFSNNISINCTAGGIASMYWGEKLQITGNLIMTRHEPWEDEWSWWDNPSKYLGPFIRLHHGPSNVGDRYGAGTVQISGNLFTNELTQRTTDILIHNGRDVTVSGNKFINGKVRKFGEGKLTVMDNEFISRMEFDPLGIEVEPRGTEAAFIKGNIFRKEEAIGTTNEETKSMELQKVPYFLFTGEASLEEGAGSIDKQDMPAISVGANSKFFGLVEDNFIQGWKQAIVGKFSRMKDAKLVVAKNTTDGKIQVDRSEKAPGIKIEMNTSFNE